jgi:hypothetical protein
LHSASEHHVLLLLHTLDSLLHGDHCGHRIVFRTEQALPIAALSAGVGPQQRPDVAHNSTAAVSFRADATCRRSSMANINVSNIFSSKHAVSIATVNFERDFRFML